MAKRFSNEKDIGPDELQQLLLVDFEDIVPKSLRRSSEKPSKSAKERLTDLIGLEEVKELVNNRIGFMRAQKLQRDRGCKTSFVPAHMAFMGNPGTGKTEVAHLVAEILKDEGLLAVGEFIQVMPSQLIRPEMVAPLFERARGSVIFIDEAYALLFQVDVVAALVDAMDRYRNEVIVIMAGYTEAVDILLHLNPGLVSRIRTKIKFSDYTPDELMEIFTLMCRQRGYILSEGIYDQVKQTIDKQIKNQYFGNARFIRNLIEDMMIVQGSRIARLIDKKGQDAVSTRRLTTFVRSDAAKVLAEISKKIDSVKRKNDVGFS